LTQATPSFLCIIVVYAQSMCDQQDVCVCESVCGSFVLKRRSKFVSLT